MQKTLPGIRNISYSSRNSEILPFRSVPGGPWVGQYKLAGAIKVVKNGKVVNPPVSATSGLIGRIHHLGRKIGKKWRNGKTSRFVDFRDNTMGLRETFRWSWT